MMRPSRALVPPSSLARQSPRLPRVSPTLKGRSEVQVRGFVVHFFIVFGAVLRRLPPRASFFF